MRVYVTVVYVAALSLKEFDMALWPEDGVENWNATMNAFLDVAHDMTSGNIKKLAKKSEALTGEEDDLVVPDKKYVDDNIDSAYAGGESHTFGGGLIIKTGRESFSASKTVSFDVDFPSAIVSVNATLESSTGSNDTAVSVSSITVGGFVMKMASGTPGTGYGWIAIGH